MQVAIKQKKGLKEYVKRDAAGQCIWGHDGSSHENWFVFKMCHILDKIEGPDAETIVWESMRMFCVWGQTKNHSVSLYS